MYVNPVDIYGKGECRLKLNLYYAMKAQRGSRGQILVCNVDASWGWVVNATSRPPYPRERTDTRFTRGWVGSSVVLDGWGKSPPPHRISIPGPSTHSCCH